VVQDVISYNSRNGKEFKSEIRIRRYMRDLTKTIVLRKQIISTSIHSEYLYKHFNPNLGFARINISEDPAFSTGGRPIFKFK
jgi:hypothetical protein